MTLGFSLGLKKGMSLSEIWDVCHFRSCKKQTLESDEKCTFTGGKHLQKIKQNAARLGGEDRSADLARRKGEVSRTAKHWAGGQSADGKVFHGAGSGCCTSMLSGEGCRDDLGVTMVIAFPFPGSVFSSRVSSIRVTCVSISSAPSFSLSPLSSPPWEARQPRTQWSSLSVLTVSLQPISNDSNSTSSDLSGAYSFLGQYSFLRFHICRGHCQVLKTVLFTFTLGSSPDASDTSPCTTSSPTI